MAGNRKLPFGYRMELGRVVVHSAEVDVVQDIFHQYILGASYKELVDHLREQEVPYDHDKLWNKNMVARILENGKYIGQDGWPAIIAAEQFDRALEKRSSKVTPPQRTEAQKVLRRLGGGSSAAVEQTILCVLNLLAANPQQIAVPQSPPSNSSRIAELQSALDHELEQRPVNEDTAKRLAMELAAAQYEGIGNQEYETQRLQRLFQRHAPMENLDAGLLQSAVSKVEIHSQKVKIHLKNGQIFERSIAL